MVLKYLKLSNQAHKNQAIWRRISWPNNHFWLGYPDSRLNCEVQSFSVVKCLNDLQIQKLQILVKVYILNIFSMSRNHLGTHTSGRTKQHNFQEKLSTCDDFLTWLFSFLARFSQLPFCLSRSLPTIWSREPCFGKQTTNGRCCLAKDKDTHTLLICYPKRNELAMHPYSLNSKGTY